MNKVAILSTRWPRESRTTSPCVRRRISGPREMRRHCNANYIITIIISSSSSSSSISIIVIIIIIIIIIFMFIIIYSIMFIIIISSCAAIARRCDVAQLGVGAYHDILREWFHVL